MAIEPKRRTACWSNLQLLQQLQHQFYSLIQWEGTVGLEIHTLTVLDGVPF
jgi:hypothetical protein